MFTQPTAHRHAHRLLTIVTAAVLLAFPVVGLLHGYDQGEIAVLGVISGLVVAVAVVARRKRSRRVDGEPVAVTGAVLHHDVSPGNILIRRSDGAAKLADFGLGSDAFNGSAERGAYVTGTPGYVAPEILYGATPSPRSDLYSLGVVAYRLLAGPSRARRGDPEATAPLLTAARRMPPLADARPDLPHGLIDAIQQAVAHEPDMRQASVAEFRAQLVDGHSAPLRLQRDQASFPEAARRELPSAA